MIFNLFFYVVVIVVIILLWLIYLYLEPRIAEREIWRRLKSNEFETSRVPRVIKLGTYITGHPEINGIIENSVILQRNSDLWIMEPFSTEYPKIRGRIPGRAIRRILDESVWNVERRKVYELSMNEPGFEYVRDKYMKDNSRFLVIEWGFVQPWNETVFECSEIKNIFIGVNGLKRAIDSIEIYY
ncbi:MAG: hypothetical protein ABIV51_12875 [Saprospiraceae bacterium]